MGLNIDVEGLKLAYDTVPVLDGTNFRVERGDLVALLGANGAGKSTLLRCISRILQPAAGSILLDGRELRHFSSREAARLMAVVPQETAADFDFTVEDIVMMGRFPYLRRFRKEEGKDHDAVRRAMEMTGVAHLAERSIAALSGGEKQRVIMARAVAQQPEVLLLDEPTANLDIGYQSMFLELAARLNREQGVTVIAAIHDINLAVHHFNRFILLSGGRVLAAGRAEEVITSENIQKSYGVKASIYRHPLHGVLQVSVVGKEKNAAINQNGPEVHVIGGGEEALPVLELLSQSGYRLSVGPVSAQDSSCRFAHFHSFPVVIVPPFTSMKSEHRQEHLSLMRRASAIVVPPIPFGEGNLPILEQVTVILAEGKKVYLIDLRGVAERDYSGGKALKLLQEMVGNGAVAMETIESLPEIIGSSGGGMDE
ncbi:MAG: ABC transporter ATP-binding protein [Bacillota bacterium]|nr:ABC transporter ATP-binding protein [Bacillota bacterium]